MKAKRMDKMAKKKPRGWRIWHKKKKIRKRQEAAKKGEKIIVSQHTNFFQFQFNNVYLTYPHSDELHNHIMDLIPNLNILGNDLTGKITTLEVDFTTVRILDRDNPEMA
ncbi:hypothetical protein H5410_036572 [Solanum commersonii]|uniref:Uncharacterized protein n=1 Tax=Solanum commersonii TaxID=4109 RepID=A0A9J5Y7U5_SOLCO|nr:hypothetical protein H5410_036572 [Solanum commersonii]